MRGKMELNSKDKSFISWLLLLILTLSGGLMDAYSYVNRGNVFSNAQTGNLILLGINISIGNFNNMIIYLCPILSFVVGILLAVFLKNKFHKKGFYFEVIVISLEIIIMLISMFIPQTLNIVCTSLLSLACGLQVETFRSFHQHSIATTMCIGNLRAGTESFAEFFDKKDLKYLKDSLLYFTIVFVFVLGAVLGYFLVKWFANYAIGFSGILLLMNLILILMKNKAIID